MTAGVVIEAEPCTWHGQQADERLAVVGSWVYVAFDRDYRAIYVGITSDLTRRIAQHRARAPWRQDVWFFLADGPFESREQVANRERELIQLHRPRHNKQHNPVRQPTAAAALAQAAEAISAVAREMSGASA